MRKFLIVLVVFGHSCFAQDDPLKNTDFKGVIKSFTEAGKRKYEDLPKPEGITLKTPCTLYFDGANCTKSNHKILHRTTNFVIKVPAEFLGSKPKKPSRPLKNVDVGRVTIIENSENPGIDGRFSLHYIGIHKKYQGKGFGSTALDLVILFAQQLASKSSFYERLTLQCADYDGKRHLGDDPRRLAFYLNHGFHIDPITLNYFPFLDVRHFVLSMNVEKFGDFLKHHDGTSNTEVDPYSLVSYLHHAEPILAILQERYRQTPPIQGDSLLQIAESNSSKAATRMLTRVDFASYFKEGDLKQCCEQVYVMQLDVKNWSQELHKRRSLIQSRKNEEAKVFNPEEDNALLFQIDQAHKDCLTRPIVPIFSVVTQIGEDIQRATKLRKVESGETIGDAEVIPASSGLPQ